MKKRLLSIFLLCITGVIAKEKSHRVLAPQQWKDAVVIFEEQSRAVIKSNTIKPVIIHVNRCISEQSLKKGAAFKLQRGEVSFVYEHNRDKTKFHCKGRIEK